MEQISIVYWSQTGNTEAMALAVAEGVKAAGKEAVLLPVAAASADELAKENTFALGCPAMGAEVLEEGEMEPFFTNLEENIKGKKIALFGSFGWGDGQWMRDWEDRIRDAGAEVLTGEGIICQNTPDEKALEACRSIGSQMAKL
ncbi:MAG: flavodoxin [Lachnospiraceae bacterium]|nr:flavodoxin [Lachnospiraceae bacterium]